MGPQISEVTFGGSLHLSCKRDQIKMRDYMDRRGTPPKRVTSPTWGPLGAKNRYLISRKSNQNWTVLMNCPRCRELDLEREKMPNTFEKRLILTLSWLDSLTIVA